MPYLDARQFGNELDLVKDGMMSIEDVHRYRMVPLQVGSEYRAV